MVRGVEPYTGFIFISVVEFNKCIFGANVIDFEKLKFSCIQILEFFTLIIYFHVSREKFQIFIN